MMKVYKFGGASVKDASAVLNVGNILRSFSGDKLIVVISAMGKTTNALEEILELWMKKSDYTEKLINLKAYHVEIMEELKKANDQVDFSAISELFKELTEILKEEASEYYDFEYDRLVSFGELISTRIVEAYLKAHGLPVEWMDVRHVIRTNSEHRRAEVDWDRSQNQSSVLANHLNDSGVNIVITQGFIAGDKLGNTTTLGREGSDYSAAILAYLLDAEEVTIWKDVPGMLNADPRWFHNTVKLDKISFREAIELSYYGASVIHPKTIQPLKKKSILLYVKSFMNPEDKGSVIQESDESDSLIPSYIFKPDQWLVSISPKDFSFIVEEHLTEIFEVLSTIGININLMQNSAISFSFAIDADKRKIDRLLTRLSGSYKVKYNTGLQLLTVRHYDEKVIRELTKGKEVLLEQRSRSTVRMVLRAEN